jgi:hypothetical protein
MNRFRIRLGSHKGMPESRSLDVLKAIETSVNTKASQVITPTENSNLIMAFVRMKLLKTSEIAEKISQS